MNNQETKVFTINLISETVSISLENLFNATSNFVQQEKNKIQLKPKARKGFRKRKNLPNKKKDELEKTNQRLKFIMGRQYRVAMLYSFMALEHVTFEICNKLRKNNDTDFMTNQKGVAEKARNSFWDINIQTNTVQLRDTKKAIKYLLKRTEIQSDSCGCKNHFSDPKINSFLTHGLKIRNTFVHGISGEKELNFKPVGDKIIKKIDKNKHQEIQKMEATTKSISVTSFSAAIQQLRDDKVFFVVTPMAIQVTSAYQ